MLGLLVCLLDCFVVSACVYVCWSGGFVGCTFAFVGCLLVYAFACSCACLFLCGFVCLYVCLCVYDILALRVCLLVCLLA